MRFSVITPSFRQLDWLELCAASIADQGVELEHIVQDPGSPGIDAWAATHPQVQVVVEKDANMYDAVNRGLRRAKGDICSYLNCDEQYLPDTLRRVGDYFARHLEVDVLFGDAVIADSSMTPIVYRRAVRPLYWHALMCPLGVLTCSTFFRRKLVDEGALFDASWKTVGDKSWILTLLDRGYRMAVLPEPLSVFTFTGENLSRQPELPAERLLWKKKRVPPLARLFRPLVNLQHWWRKWRAGAYRPFRGDLSYYRPGHLARRAEFRGLTLSGVWPARFNADAKPPAASPIHEPQS